MFFKAVAPAIIVAFFAVLPGLQAQEDHEAWHTDFDQALKTAGESGKDLLVDFSGSDWCGWCKKLDKEVFSHEEFLNKVQENYLLVLLDFPRNKTVPNAERNQELSNRFKVKGFPTVLLLDPTGRPYARTGYQEGGPEAYLSHLAGLKEISGMLTQKIEQVEKLGEDELPSALNALFELIDSLGEKKYDFAYHFSLGFPQLGSVVSKAYTIDPENKSGLKLKAALFLMDMEQIDPATIKALNELDPQNKAGYLEKLLVVELSTKDPRDPADAKETVRLVETFLKDKTIQDPEAAAWVPFIAGYACYKGLGDNEKAKGFFEKVLEVQPSGGRWSDNAKKFLEMIKSGK